jgi:hypothetical protein
MPKTDKAPAQESGPKAVSFVGKRPGKNNPGPEVNMPCQRGKDIKTKGQYCDSKRAFNTTPNPGTGGKVASFECCKCHFQWSVDMGGQFSGA